MQNTGPSQRQLRVGEQIRHIIVEMLQRGHFADEILMNAAHNITVTEVRASPDLKQVTAFMIALDGQDMSAIIPALNKISYVFQKDINSKATLKFTPKVRFKLDGAHEKVQRLDEIFSTIKYSDQSDDDIAE